MPGPKRRLLIAAAAAALFAGACSGGDDVAATTVPDTADVPTDTTGTSPPEFSVVDVFSQLDAAGIGCTQTTQADPAGLDQARSAVPLLAGMTSAGSCRYPPSDRPDLPADSLSVATFGGERERLVFSLASFDSACGELPAGPAEVLYVHGPDWVLWGSGATGEGPMSSIAAATGGAVGSAECTRVGFALRSLCPNPFAKVTDCDPAPAEDDFFRAALGEPTETAEAATVRDQLLAYFQTGVLTARLTAPGPETRFEYEEQGGGFAVRYPSSWTVAEEDPALPDVTFVAAPTGEDGFPARVNISRVDFPSDFDLVDFRNTGDAQTSACISDRQVLSGEAHPTTPRWFPRIGGSRAGQTLHAFVVAYTGSAGIPAECDATRDTAAYPLPVPHADERADSGDLVWLIAFVTDRGIEERGSYGYVVTYVAPADEFLHRLAEVGVIFDSLIFTGNPSVPQDG